MCCLQVTEEHSDARLARIMVPSVQTKYRTATDFIVGQTGTSATPATKFYDLCLIFLHIKKNVSYGQILV